MLLYRFLDAKAAILTIEKQRLMVSRVRGLNDPFEMMPFFGDDLDDADLGHPRSQQLLKNFNSEYGLISFSSRVDEPVLWSHYADRHTGICLAFEVEVEPDALFEIVYSDSKPYVSKSEASASAENDVYMELLRRKSTGWAYESEFRTYEDLADCKSSDGLYFVGLGKEYQLKEVLIGWRCEIDANYIHSALQGRYSSVRVKKAVSQQGSYRVGFVEV